MRRTLRVIVAVLAGVAGLAGIGFTADQTILGKTLTVKNGGTPQQRKVVGSAKEKNSPNTLVGNPTTGGGVLSVFLNGTSPSTQVFNLPQGTGPSGKPFWSATSTGFQYRDSTGAQSAVKSISIKRSNSGSFGIKASINGKLGVVNLLPPNTGTDGCMSLQLGTGDLYHVKFAPPATVSNNGTKLFKVKKPFTEGLCPNAGPTTTTTSTTTPSTGSTSTSTTASTSTTTSTTLYGSPSRAFLAPAADLLD
jgi:hypothetical protein